MNKFHNRRVYFFSLTFIVTLFLCLTNCALPPERGASQQTSFAKADKSSSNGKVTQAELQDDLLRFESQFNARIQNANQTLESSKNLKTRYRAALNRLIYGSNSLNIALGPSPESNLLDMVTFIELSHDALNRHWIPKVFGSEGQALNQAFLDSKRQIWAIAQKVLNTEQANLLKQIILRWRIKHPDQINVETVRLSSFSTEAGARAEGLNEGVGGLFASIQQSTLAVDSVRLFAERALYYSERAPFLFQLQARLGVYEIMDDTGLGLTQIAHSLGDERTVKNLLKELQQTLLISRLTLNDAKSTINSINSLVDQISENPETANLATSTIAELSHLLNEWNQLLSSASYQKGISELGNIANQMNRESNRFMNKLAWLGVGLIAFFWTMFVLSKLVYQYFQLRLLSRFKPANEDKPKDKAA